MVTMKTSMRGRSFGGVLAAAAALLAGACSSGTQPDEKPTQAVIRVEGTTPGALRLVVSTDFYERVHPTTGEIIQVLNSSDTLTVSGLPYRHAAPLGSLGSVYVSLSNAAVESAAVRLRVELDNGRGYDQSATMSEGGTLTYVYVFLQTVI